LILNNDGIFAAAEQYLPKYLTPTERADLFEELRKFPKYTKPFFLDATKFIDEILQGDGWRGLSAINFFTLKKKPIPGLILSNSCDISPDNKRVRGPSILFCPLIRLADYKQHLLSRGQTEEAISSLFEIIKIQEKTDVFYLPENKGIMDESIVFLDDIHAHPMEDFQESEKHKMHTLSQHAFYVFLIKLSIHFSRFQEGVHRN